jgi:hypothetical protein
MSAERNPYSQARPMAGVDSTISTSPTLLVRSLIEMAAKRNRCSSSPLYRRGETKTFAVIADDQHGLFCHTFTMTCVVRACFFTVKCFTVNLKNFPTDAVGQIDDGSIHQ